MGLKFQIAMLSIHPPTESLAAGSQGQPRAKCRQDVRRNLGECHEQEAQRHKDPADRDEHRAAGMAGNRTKNKAGPPSPFLPTPPVYGPPLGLLVRQSRRQSLADPSRPADRPAGYLTAPADVQAELVFQGLGQARVLDQDVELVISQQARGVQIARPDAHPAVIAHDGFGMKHRTILFKDTDSAAQEVPVPDAGEIPDQRQIARAGNQQPDVDPLVGRVHPRSTQVGTCAWLDAGGKAAFFAADAIDPASLTAAHHEIEAKLGGPTVLVNAAGGNDPKVTVTPERPFETIDLEDWRTNFEMNLVGGVLLPCQEFGPAMASRGKGRRLSR